MADLRTCPVCNMDVNPADAPSETFRDQEYSFCSETCREQFLMDPERYARA
ncbi:YHS domain-containing protein [Tessaracoccus bendigoensis DSM 12906]|uniref:YHS domain-containing protein n=1 Tax=Tessaracoccus bendigoensis DSM 12906 TaxID=1123357 RepID=A0A1M6ES48_9ACTN|nr:YHS domain-containing protein [Tessaracoccus bendigoensis]SHI88312.1 YHS domain-containing protein [Tessaracoccus bendigoensis DSM 12906]